VSADSIRIELLLLTLKSLSEGALMWYLQRSVTKRVAKITLGMECTPEYDRGDPEHRKRKGLLLQSVE
jgi:hypothetical protein